MIAVILALGENRALDPVNRRMAAPMMPLVDRPAIQHLVELLAASGILEFRFLLSHLPGQAEDYLGDGTRWGCRFTHHLLRDESVIGRALRALSPPSGPVLLANADRLPVLTGEARAKMEAGAPFMLTHGGEWTGWALFDAGTFSGCAELDSLEALEGWVARSVAPEDRMETGECLDLRSFGGFLEAHAAALRGVLPGMLFSARQAGEGVWISRNVSLQPTVRLIPPVYVGEDCRIEAGVHLGPNTVVGARSIVDARTAAENTIVFPGTYVGEALELEHAVIDRNTLINARLGSDITIKDAFILGHVSGVRVRRRLLGMVDRIAALILFVLLLPPMLAALLVARARGGGWRSMEVVCLPAERQPALWRKIRLNHLSFSSDPCPPDPARRLAHLLGRFAPGLPAVFLGKMSLVGLPSRSAAELMGLGEGWRDLCLAAKGGLISEADINGAGDDPDLRYTSDCVYAARASLRHDISILWRYLLGAGRKLATETGTGGAS